MSLKYYDAYNATRTNTPKETYIEDFTAMQELAFENAPNVYYGDADDCVEFEYEYGSNQFRPIPLVRVDDVVSYNTGLFSSDDFKVFVFMRDWADQHICTYGNKFRWRDNIWLVINSSELNGMGVSVEVRRCNNVAKFYDKIGNEIYEPCIMDVVLRFTRNQTNAPIVTSNGEQKMWIQRNDSTNLILPNQRFLFGPPADRKCWKVYGSGEKNYLNTQTFDDNSISLSEFYMTHDQLDEQRDDIIRGFADARIAFYSIKGTDITGEYQIGDEVPLEFVVYKDKDVTDEEIHYMIDNQRIATIEDNRLLLHQNGKVKLTVLMAKNPNIKQEFIINVVETPEVEYQIKILPEQSYLLQGQKMVFECGLYRNGALERHPVNFDIKDITVGVPQDKYIIKIINSYSFEIYNKSMFMSKPVKVQVSTGNITQEFSFELRGVY